MPGRPAWRARPLRILAITTIFGVVLPATAAHLQTSLTVTAVVTASCTVTLATPSGGTPRVQSRCSRNHPATVRTGVEAGLPPLTPAFGQEATQGLLQTVVIY
jgi:hypothetical protein